MSYHSFRLVVFAPFLVVGVGCSSDSDDTVDPGIDHPGGGYEKDSASQTGGVAAYPDGPYGRGAGATVRNFKFAGFANPKEANYKATAETISTLRFSDYYNPTDDPEKPVALLVNASARWCSVCQEEAKQSRKGYEYWREHRVEFITAIFENVDNQPAGFVDIEAWSKAYQLEYPVVLDPKLTLGAFFDKSASPFNMIIDTKTMTIVFSGEGLIEVGQNNKHLRQLTGQ